jgi:hypothetical protein
MGGADDDQYAAGGDCDAPLPDAPAQPARPPDARHLAAEHAAWVDAQWDNFSLSEKVFHDYDRAQREQRRFRYTRAIHQADAPASRMPPMGQPGNEIRGAW